MRQNLRDLINNTIVYRYSLPYNTSQRSVLGAGIDKCYHNALTSADLSTIIYNAILEYSYDEFEMDVALEALHTRALSNRLKYNEDASHDAKLKYGFYGEVLLYAVLHVLFDTPPLISRGHFYLPAENSETKGYDCYHLLDVDGEVQLWFGEVKFYQNYSRGITKALENLNNVLTDSYLSKRNLFAIFDKITANKSYPNSPLTPIIERWKNNPRIDLMTELNDNNIKLIYPVFIIADQSKADYDETIEQWITHINDGYADVEFNDISIDFSIYFIFLPVESSSLIKTTVLTWIDSNQPLI